MSTLAADKETDLVTFFQSDRELTAEIFYTVVFQLLGFSYLVDFEDAEQFRKETGFLLFMEISLKIFISYSIRERKKEIRSSINLLVMDSFQKIITTTTLTVRAWQPSLLMMSFVKSCMSRAVWILIKTDSLT